MEQRTLGTDFSISALSLGGGGIGGVWGSTDADEATRTVLAAIEAGIDFIDLAPLYRTAEERVGHVLKGTAIGSRNAAHVRVGTKCLLGDVERGTVAARLDESIAASCAAIGRDHIDVFLLHGVVISDGWRGGPMEHLLDQMGTPWSTYVDEVVPAMSALVRSGRIGRWGVTTGPRIHDMFDHDEPPQVVHAITNVLFSPGGMRITGEETNHDVQRVISDASRCGIGVIGVRAVAAGALCDEIDRDLPEAAPEVVDFQRAAGFRRGAAEWGVSAAALAHRYALSMPGVHSVVLGVKNRVELNECLAAEALPRLTPTEMASIESMVEPQ